MRLESRRRGGTEPDVATSGTGVHPSASAVVVDDLVAASPCVHDPAMALLVIRDGTFVPTVADFQRWRRALADRGYRSLRTGALGPRQAQAAGASGLQVAQELMLLAAPCGTRRGRASTPSADGSVAVRRRRALRTRRGDLAAIDAAAFGERWALGSSQLVEVMHATPHSRLWVASTREHRQPVGFLIAGWGGRAGYVQRLAVHPAHHRRGIGRRLVAAAVDDLCARDSMRVYVNTHVDNAAAIELYRRAGFSELPERLTVYEGPTGS